MADYKYDVAFSCLHEDEPVARQLHDLLEDRVKSMFLYTQNQKDALGEEGAEFFRQTYGTDSRIVVVIYREGWGKTRWTGIEDRTIRDLYLNHNVRRVLVYSVDNKTPSWLPETYLWASNQVGGFRDLAAVIARKVQEEGGDIGAEDPLAKARRLDREYAAAERRDARRSTSEAVSAAKSEVAAIHDKLQSLVVPFAAEQPRSMWANTRADVIEVYAKEAGIVAVWRQNNAGSIRRAKLVLILSNGPPGVWREETAREVGWYDLELADDEKTWEWVDSKGLRYSSEMLANKFFDVLVTTNAARKKAELLRRRRD